MFKKLTAICLALCLGLAMASCAMKKKEDKTEKKEKTTVAKTEEETEEEEFPEYEYSFGGGEATLVSYNGEAEEIDLTAPVQRYRKKTDTYEEYELAVISAGAFKNCESVKRIILPDTVTEIGAACFQNCVNLEEVVLPAGLTEISDQLFFGCDSLTTLTIPDTVESIGIFAFGDYFKRTPWYENLSGDVIVGDGILLKHTGDAATVRFDEKVKKVAYYAFLESKTAQAYFGESITEIDPLAMYRSATTVMLPNGSKLVSELKMNNVSVGTYAADGAVAEEPEAAEEPAAEEAAAEEN